MDFDERITLPVYLYTGGSSSALVRRAVEGFGVVMLVHEDDASASAETVDTP